MTDMKRFLVTYDRRADVLYISTVREVATRGMEEKEGIVWRYAGNGDLIGVTILDYRDFWYDHRDDLADEMARRFNVPADATKRVLEHALK